MDDSSDHLIFLIGASPTSDEARRLLVQRGLITRGVTGSLRGLRRQLVLGTHELVTVCLVADGPTIRRHGEALRQLLEDRVAFATPVVSVGIVDRGAKRDEAAALGCDVYVEQVRDLPRVMRRLAQHAGVSAAALERPGNETARRIVDSWPDSVWLRNERRMDVPGRVEAGGDRKVDHQEIDQRSGPCRMHGHGDGPKRGG